jgi:DNA-binding response OmpR family regulator
MAHGKILVVDDDRQITTLVEFALSRAGYEVCTANSGREALRAALAEAPALMLLDIFMPDMRGDQVLEEMLRHPRLRNIPVVLATGDVDHKPAITGFSLLAKPFSLEELYETVRAALAPA